MKWRDKPLAVAGAASIAYHEVLRGRRTGVCEDCGRLNHATAHRCLCGGNVEPNAPPGETDGVAPNPGDSLDRPAVWLAFVVGKTAVILAAVGLIIHASTTGETAYGFLAMILAAFCGRWL